MKKVLRVVPWVWMSICLLAAGKEEDLLVYSAVPGLEPSKHYTLSVRPVGDEGFDLLNGGGPVAFGQMMPSDIADGAPANYAVFCLEALSNRVGREPAIATLCLLPFRGTLLCRGGLWPRGIISNLGDPGSWDVNVHPIDDRSTVRLV